jgi:outer membrane protein TolC
MTAKRQLAALRLELARLGLVVARSRFNTGATGSASLAAAEADVRTAEADVVRLDLDLEEIRVTAAPPRDELWAPLVGSRDFVKERLGVDAIVAQQKLASSQIALAEITRAFQAGVGSSVTNADAQFAAAQARRELDMLAQKLALRKQFLEEHLAPEDVGRRLQLLELTSQIARLQEQLRIAQERVSVAKTQQASGTASTLDVKRAEVDAIEREVELSKLSIQLKRLQRLMGGG